jgi:hypothetical protein
VPHRRQPVRDHHQRLHAVQRLQCGDQLALGGRVERGGRLVEDQHLGLVIEGPGDGHALALATRQSCAALAQHRVEPARQPAHELGELGQGERGGHAPVVDVGVAHAEGDVAADRVVEEERLLGDVADVALPGPQHAGHVAAVHGDASGGRRQQPQQQIDQRALARPRRADDADRLAARDRQVDVEQHRLGLAGVGEGHALEHDRVREADRLATLGGLGRRRGQRGEVGAQVVDPGPAVAQLADVHHDAIRRGDDAEAGVGVQAEQRQRGGTAAQGQQQAHREQPAHERRLHAHAESRGDRRVARAQSGGPGHALVELGQEEALASGELHFLHPAQALLQGL